MEEIKEFNGTTCPYCQKDEAEYLEELDTETERWTCNNCDKSFIIDIEKKRTITMPKKAKKDKKMKTYKVTVHIRAECESDLRERIEDEENPIDNYVIGSIKEIEEE